MLRVTEQNEPGAWRLTLEGTLAGRWAAEAERVWSGAPAGKPREVDLRGVTSVDRAGRELLHRMHHDGASFVAEGVVMKALVEELRSERFDRAGTIVRLVGVVALIGLASVAAAHAQTIGPTALSMERGPGAQPPPSATLRLTPQQAVSIGLQQSPEVAIAHLNLVEAQEGRTAARSALLPQISFNANEKVTRASLEALFGTKVPGFPDHSGPFWALQAGLGGSAPIFDLTVWNQWRAAREHVNARAADQITARELNAQLVVSQFLFVPINVAAFRAVPRDRLGHATGLLNLIRNIGGSGGIAMITTLIARRQQFHQGHLVSHVTPMDPGYAATLHKTAANFVAHGASAADTAGQAQGVLYAMVQRQAAMMAVNDTFWVLSLVFLAMIPIVLLLKSTPRVAGPLPME